MVQCLCYSPCLHRQQDQECLFHRQRLHDRFLAVQHLFVYANQKYSVTLPSASSVATMFGYSTLPSDFACIFTLIYNYNWGNSLVFTNIRNHNGDLASYTLAKGDSITVLCANYPSFHYQILNHSY